MSRITRITLISLVTVFTSGLAACNDDGSGSGSSLRLGYFPNVTHAAAIVAVENEFVEENLPEGWSLGTSTFNAGGDAVQALLSGSIHATFIGPNPAINGWATSYDDGTGLGELRIVSGAASGGAFLVVQPEITSPEDLEGTTLSTPALGNTQDVALRAWLADEGYETDTAGGGDVSVLPQENPQILSTFIDGRIDGAWVPQPWATRLVEEGGGHILVDERDLWPDGEYVTTHLIVRADFLEEHPDVVEGLIEANLEAVAFIETDRAEAEAIVAAGIEEITDREIPAELVTASFDTLDFTYDPIAPSLQQSAEDATAFDLLDPVDLDGIYDLTILDELLAQRQLDPVDGL